MRILILGGDGMLGHQLLKQYQSRHDVSVTVRQQLSQYSDYGLYHGNNTFPGVDAVNFGDVEKTIRDFQPEAVINAIGIVKQRSEAQDVILSLEINALLPHRLSLLCDDMAARLVHVSTDCVFSGAKGMYTEDDREDAVDLYGRSKLLGEVRDSQAVTLRTSIIGLELARKKSLVEWFLAQRGTIKGFTRAVYSGFTTQEMARIIELVLTKKRGISGLWHVASAPISKHELLTLLSAKLGRRDISIESDDAFVCDRSLNGTRFKAETGYAPPSWDTMLDELAAEVQEQRG